MWEILAYALIAAGSVLSTYFTNKQSKEESDKQRQWQENMMDKQNEYNRLSNQFDRAEEAGVNPLAMTMGNGLTVSGNTSVSPGNYQLPNILDPMSMLGSGASNLASAFNSTQKGLSDKTFRVATLDQIQNQNQQILAYTKNLNASSDAQIIANKYADARELWALAGNKADVSLTYAQVAKTNASTRETIQNIKNLIASEIESQTNIELNYLKMDEVLAHIDSIKADTALTEQKTLESVAKTAEIEQNTDLLSAQTDKTTQEADRYGELTDKVIAEYDALIKKYIAETGKTEEEAYWILFDKADQYTPKIMGMSIDTVGAAKRVRQVRDRWRAKVGRNASEW